ncbi:hypothetical protein FF2_015287 [Malus domestica]
MTKGNSPTSEYLQRIKEVTDALAAAGAPFDDHDILLIILNGLLDDYAFVNYVQFHLTDTIVDYLHGFLLNKEIALARKQHIQGSSTKPFQAFNVQASSTNAHFLPTAHVPPQQQAYTVHPQQFPNSNLGSYQ